MKRETGHTWLLLSRRKAAKLLRYFSRAEFERCLSHRSSDKVISNIGKPTVKCPEIFPSTLPSASCVHALGLWLGCGQRTEDLVPLFVTRAHLHLQSSWRVMGIWFHSTGWGRGQRDEPSRRETPKTLSPPQILSQRPGIELIAGAEGGVIFVRTLPKANGLDGRAAKTPDFLDQSQGTGPRSHSG